MVMNSLSTAMSDKLPSLSLQLLVNEQCPTFCRLPLFTAFITAAPSATWWLFLRYSATSSRRCAALQQQAWTAAALESG